MCDITKGKVVDKTNNIKLSLKYYQLLNLSTNGELDITADIITDEDDIPSQSYAILKFSIARYLVKKNIPLIQVHYCSDYSIYIELLSMYSQDAVISFISDFVKDFNNFETNYSLFSYVSWDHEEYYECAKNLVNRFYKAVVEEGNWEYIYEDFEVGDYSYRYGDDNQ